MDIGAERLEELKITAKERGLNTLKSLMNTALTLFDWVITMRKEGFKIVAIKEENGKIIKIRELEMPCLPKISN